ncbi:MAG: 1,4-dihydroxy-2-naphthoate polyprenyltransferase [bacterium]
MNPASLTIWIMAARPKTLPAAAAPVLIGTAMAFESGGAHWPAALVALLGALLIQIGTNLANDYFDFRKGVDQHDRLGPTRVTQAGLVTPKAMKAAIVVVFSLAILAGCYLVWRGGWPLVVIGLSSILFGIMYTGGPFPLGYHGLGDIFVLIFFGPVAVGGTYYVQALDINWTVALVGLSPGLFSVAILTVNNLRDIESDRATGKKTLAVRWGRTFAHTEYLSCLLLAVAIPIAICLKTQLHLEVLATALVIPAAIPAIRTVFGNQDGDALNKVLAATGRLLLLFTLIFSVAWLL